MSDQTDPQQARDAFDREEIDAMRQLRRSGETARNIAQTFRTSASIVQRICALDAVPPAPAPAQQVSPNDAAVLRAAIRSLDCGVHHCRYCEAKSPAWEHVQGCAYVESQRHYREAYDIIQRLEAHPAAPAPPRHERQEQEPLRKALQSLRNDCAGLLGVWWNDLRDAVGITNVRVLEAHIKEADDVLAAASPSAPQGWQPINERTPRDREVFFWLVPKTAEETYCDTSGKPIVTTTKPFRHECKWGCWGSLFKPLYWQEPPAPPVDPGAR